MDKAISVRFFRIVGSGEREVSLLRRIAQVNAIPEGQERVRLVADLDFWVDRIGIVGTVATGRLCRRQTSHLPPQASPDGRLTRLGAPALGHNAVWQYDAELSVLAIELMRNGAGPSKLIAYVRNICDCRGYAAHPVLDDAALVAAEHGRIRELSVRVATPRNLNTVVPDQQRIKQGMVELMGSNISTQVEIKFSVAAGNPDIQPGRFQQVVSWFKGEKEADRGTISKLQARIVDEEGASSTLDLLDSHLGLRRDLDLPNDDPDASAAIRLANVQNVFDTYRPALERQFGQ